MDKVGLVTGASRGIGRAIAEALAAAGYAVAVNFASRREEAEAVAAAIRATGGTAVPVQADVSDPAAVERMFAVVDREWGRLDALVNNAGIGQRVEIGSPLVRNPSTVIALNNPSAEKYEPQLATNGYLFYNSSLVSHQFTRRNIHAVPIAGSGAAAELGHAKLLNMVMLGAMLAHVPALPLEVVEQALDNHIPARRRDLLEANKLALRKAIELAQQAVPIPA